MVVQFKGQEVRDMHVWSRPIRFDEFVCEFNWQEPVELIDGVVVEKTMIQLDHFRLEKWLLKLLDSYAQRTESGELFGSRSPVKISDFRGRMPDLFFVRRDRLSIVTQRATLGAPDMVLEIVSPGDRPSDMVALEVDYTFLGVPEIVFIDQRKRCVRVLRKREAAYVDEVLTDGALELESLGVRLELSWLFDEPRPDELEILRGWLESRS